ncbi:MAG: hypothetical protein HY804_00060 [Nitrospinae bacterium]|nr:hypothetical protein [Nitrospinota bacterium]
MSRENLESSFSRLRETSFEITSEETIDYNCIAWAAGDTERWWWPGGYFWPDNAPDGVSQKTFLDTFMKMGFEICKNGDIESGFEKIALYVDDDKQPTHMARQLPNGKWTSKCGRLEDISHDLEGLEGPAYGRVTYFLRRLLSP